MDKIYLVYCGFACEFYDVIGVFSAKVLAEEFIDYILSMDKKDCLQNPSQLMMSKDDFDIEEIEINKYDFNQWPLSRWKSDGQ